MLLIVSSRTLPPSSNDHRSIDSPQRFKTIFEENDLFFSPVTAKDEENADSADSADPLGLKPAIAARNVSKDELKFNKQKIRVIVTNPSQEDETFAIPCISGPSGTPKTVRWLMDETSRRYKALYKTKVYVN